MSKTRISPELRKIVTDRAQNCYEYCLMPDIFSLVAFEVDQTQKQEKSFRCIIQEIKHGHSTSK